MPKLAWADGGYAGKLVTYIFWSMIITMTRRLARTRAPAHAT